MKSTAATAAVTAAAALGHGRKSHKRATNQELK
jgi:hypothetical protein